MPDPRPPLDLAKGDTGDPEQQEASYPPNQIEANDRRTIRQAIMTQLLREVADEIIGSGVTVTCARKGVKGNLVNEFSPMKFPKFYALLTNTEKAFNDVRDRLYVSQSLGS